MCSIRQARPRPRKASLPFYSALLDIELDLVGKTYRLHSHKGVASLYSFETAGDRRGDCD